jgi:hypothetical protein
MRSRLELLFITLALLLVSCETKHSNENKMNDLVELPSHRMRCLFFFIPDCPASKACMAPFGELIRRYESHGLEALGIVSDPKPDTVLLEALLKESRLDLPLVLDTNLEYAHKQGATTTPQFFLLDSLDQVLYSGLIDNYYYAFGKHRARVSENYLQDAIEAYLLGKKIAVKETEAIGCKINYDKSH